MNSSDSSDSKEANNDFKNKLKEIQIPQDFHVGLQKRIFNIILTRNYIYNDR